VGDELVYLNDNGIRAEYINSVVFVVEYVQMIPLVSETMQQGWWDDRVNLELRLCWKDVVVAQLQNLFRILLIISANYVSPPHQLF
jgi:hypothetical protein